MYYPTPISQLPSHYLYVYAFPCTLLISLTKYDIHLPPLMWLETHSYHSLVRLAQHDAEWLMHSAGSLSSDQSCTHITHTPVGTSRLFGYKFIWISRSLVDRGCVTDVTPINVALRNTMKPLVSLKMRYAFQSARPTKGEFRKKSWQVSWASAGMLRAIWVTKGGA